MCNRHSSLDNIEGKRFFRRHFLVTQDTPALAGVEKSEQIDKQMSFATYDVCSNSF